MSLDLGGASGASRRDFSRLTSLPRLSFSLDADYDIKDVIGKGQYGVCRKAIRRSDGLEVAVKSISRAKLLTHQDLEEVDREIAIMRHLAGHPNIVQIYEVYEDKSYIHLVQVRPAPLSFPSPAFPVILTNSPPSPVPPQRATQKQP